MFPARLLATGTTTPQPATTVSLTAESNGINYVKVAAVKVNSDDVVKADGDKLYAYVTEDSFETKKDGDTVTAFKAIVGNSTEATDLYEDGTTNVGVKAGSVIVYTVDGDEIDVQAVVSAANYTTYRNSGAYAIKGFDGKKKGDMSLVKADGTVTSVTLDEDCVFIGVDDAKNVGTVSEIGAVPTSADKDEFDRYDMNAYVVFNSDNKVAAVVYDTVNNELDISNVKTASTAAAQALTVATSSVTATGTDNAATFAVATAPATGNVKWGHYRYRNCYSDHRCYCWQQGCCNRKGWYHHRWHPDLCSWCSWRYRSSDCNVHHAERCYRSFRCCCNFRSCCLINSR